MDEIDLDTNDIRCPKCNDDQYVKNGIVRNVQRYRCNSCGSNFSTDFKHRWPPSSKLLNLLLLRHGEPVDSLGAPQQTINRWVSEAKEHHPWFARALAESVIYGVEQRGETMHHAISAVLMMYQNITGHSAAGSDFPDAMIADMVQLAEQPFLDELVLFMKSLPSPNQSS